MRRSAVKWCKSSAWCDLSSQQGNHRVINSATAFRSESELEKPSDQLGILVKPIRISQRKGRIGSESLLIKLVTKPLERFISAIWLELRYLLAYIPQVLIFKLMGSNR